MSERNEGKQVVPPSPAPAESQSRTIRTTRRIFAFGSSLLTAAATGARVAFAQEEPTVTQPQPDTSQDESTMFTSNAGETPFDPNKQQEKDPSATLRPFKTTYDVPIKTNRPGQPDHYIKGINPPEGLKGLKVDMDKEVLMYQYATDQVTPLRTPQGAPIQAPSIAGAEMTRILDENNVPGIVFAPFPKDFPKGNRNIRLGNSGTAEAQEHFMDIDTVIKPQELYPDAPDAIVFFYDYPPTSKDPSPSRQEDIKYAILADIAEAIFAYQKSTPKTFVRLQASTDPKLMRITTDIDSIMPLEQIFPS